MLESTSFSPKPEIAAEIQALERRIADRHSCELLASCFLDPTRELLWGNLRDISLAGLAVIMDRELEAGTRMLVQMRSASEGRLVALAVRVTHSTGEAPGKWMVGCRFIGDLANEDLRALLNH